MQLGTLGSKRVDPKGPWTRQFYPHGGVAADIGADRNTSVLFEGLWGRGSLAGFHRIRYARESPPGRMGFVIPIG